jgi:hypothetical protein
MGIWNVQWPYVAYVAVRSVAAIIMLGLLWHETKDVSHAVGQGLADCCAAASVVGMSSGDLRATVGLWWVAVFLYFLGWEVYRARRQLWAFGEDSDIASAGSWGRTGGVFLWESLANAPPLIAGVFLMLDAMAPDLVTFPGV